MRLGDIDCGCSEENLEGNQLNNRKYIMFQAGQLGLVEAGILTLSSLIVLLAWRVKGKVK
jgi:hypothetical protein